MTAKTVHLPIINLQRLLIHNLRRLVSTRIYDIGRVVCSRARNGIRQPSTGIHRAKQYVNDRVAGLLSWYAGMQDRGDVRVVDPRLDEHGADDMLHDDGVTADRGSGTNEVLAIPPECEVVPVACIIVYRNVAYVAARSVSIQGRTTCQASSDTHLRQSPHSRTQDKRLPDWPRSSPVRG